jgi:GT2 family glycosyltransferase
MISIFYSTRKSNPKHSKELKKSCVLKNVEIIEFVNEGTHSLAQAYNYAIQASKYDILVCLHDDVYLEKGWDKKILKYFNESDYGILGVAGTTDLSSTGMWWKEQHRMVGNVFHKTQKGKWVETKYCEKRPNEIIPVVCIDGLFMALDKTKIQEKFDERFDGFHFYDIPFCLANYRKEVEIGVITDIKIKHDSIGVPNEKWYENREKFVELYQSQLPANVIPPIIYKNKVISLKREPKLGIIIPSKDNFEYLERCIRSLIKTNYSNYTIYLADTGSDETTLDKIKGLYKEVNENNPDRMRIVRYNFYHFAKINNQVVENHMDEDTEVILFCNDDIEMVNDAISMMMEEYLKHEKHVGTIGCRLYYSNNSIQHGGIQLILTKDGKIGVTHKGIKTYYKASFNKEYDVLGNTGAFLMISRANFYKVNGFDESTEECMEDVLLNIDCIVKNLKNIYLGDAVCYHYESVTRSKNPDKVEGERRDLTQRLIPKVQKHLMTLKKYATILK